MLDHGQRVIGQPARPPVKQLDRPRPQAQPLGWRDEDDVEGRRVTAQVREDVRRHHLGARRQARLGKIVPDVGQRAR